MYLKFINILSSQTFASPAATLPPPPPSTCLTMCVTPDAMASVKKPFIAAAVAVCCDVISFQTYSYSAFLFRCDRLYSMTTFYKRYSRGELMQEMSKTAKTSDPMHHREGTQYRFPTL